MRVHVPANSTLIQKPVEFQISSMLLASLTVCKVKIAFGGYIITGKARWNGISIPAAYENPEKLNRRLNACRVNVFTIDI